jgi:hypothetical protein
MLSDNPASRKIKREVESDDDVIIISPAPAAKKAKTGNN